MANPKAPGRMIKKSIAHSNGFAKLSPEAGVLFCLILPHLDCHGKLSGELYTVKGVAAPKLEYMNLKVIESCLKEITIHTNLKWWKDKKGGCWLHAINFQKHQKLRDDRMGDDYLPSWDASIITDMCKSGSNPGLVQPKVREGKVSKEFSLKREKAESDDSRNLAEISDNHSQSIDENGYNIPNPVVSDDFFDSPETDPDPY